MYYAFSGSKPERAIARYQSIADAPVDTTTLEPITLERSKPAPPRQHEQHD